MERPATWKVVTVGVALAGFSVAGAGAAQADSGSPGTAPASVGAASDLNAPLEPFTLHTVDSPPRGSGSSPRVSGSPPPGNA